MEPGCFAPYTVLRIVPGIVLLTSVALAATPASAEGTHGPAFTVPKTVQNDGITLGELAPGSPGPYEARPAATVSEGSNGLVALTAWLGAMSVIGLASGLWFLATTPAHRRTSEALTTTQAAVSRWNYWMAKNTRLGSNENDSSTMNNPPSTWSLGTDTQTLPSASAPGNISPTSVKSSGRTPQ